jgi:hypothetical protein
MTARTMTLPAVDRSAPPDDSLVYIGAGPLLAIVLGIALIPFRESITASNLSFAFVVLTVVVAAFGGRSAGVATALASALSLDFFLTRPYLSLRIQENHDLIAFAGLTVCGLVAASLGSPQRIAALRELRAHAQLLHQTLGALEGGGPVVLLVGQRRWSHADRARRGAGGAAHVPGPPRVVVEQAVAAADRGGDGARGGGPRPRPRRPSGRDRA